MTGRPLSMVVALYNEERRMGRLIEHIARYAEGDVAAAGMRLIEVIAVDDGSTDRTAELLRVAEAELGVLRAVSDGRPNAGKGAALARGIARAQAEWVLLTDADLATPLDQLSALTPFLDQGYEVVIASRDLPGSVVTGAPRHRYLLGRTFHKLVRAVTGLQLRDTQCGFKLLRTARARELTRDQIVRRWAFDVELLLRAHRSGLEIAEVPVYYVHGDDSKINALRAGARMVLDLARLISALGPPSRPRHR
jgi:dolichyl-phosphate beta-glucosyltransferase